MYVMCVRKHSPSHLPNTDIKSLTQTTSHMYVMCVTKHSPSHLPYTDIKSLTQTSSHMYVMCATKHSPSSTLHRHKITHADHKKEKKKRKLYFNNLLYIHQHTFLKYMIHDTVGY